MHVKDMHVCTMYISVMDIHTYICAYIITYAFSKPAVYMDYCYVPML